jgi:transcriptional regulator with XRE-family HTH domain
MGCVRSAVRHWTIVPRRARGCAREDNQARNAVEETVPSSSPLYRPVCSNVLPPNGSVGFSFGCTFAPRSFRPGLPPRGIGEERVLVDADDARSIGQRLRVIRRRRGMGLAVAAGLAGISKPYLSLLERGERGFNRRGLLEDLAEAVGCSVVDLTGQPYSLPDRQSSDVAAAVAGISRALHDTTLDDVPDVSAGPLSELAPATARAHAHVDDARYGLAGQGLADLLIALHVRVVAGNSEERMGALARLAEACKVAYVLAKRTGQIELAGIAAQRGLEAARLAERPDLVGMLEMSRANTLIGLGARRRAAVVCGETLREISALSGPTPEDTRVAEACGMLHLTTALIAAREGRTGDVATHLTEARSLAAHTGERNHMRYHFGPTNVAAWELGLAVEAGTGPDAAERTREAPIDLSVFRSKGRTAYVHFDLARAWAQAEGSHDQEALRALDVADRLAPVRLRNDPIARDLVMTLGRRARRRVWELDSLRSRFGIGKG